MKILSLDTETTGLILHENAKLALQPHVIEVGGVLMDETGHRLKVIDQLIKPPIPITAEITGITGISGEMVEDKPWFSQVAPAIQEIISESDVVVAHNAPFDTGVLNFEAERLGEPFEWPDTIVCTASMNEPEWGYRPKLKELYEKLVGEHWEQSHRALDDAEKLAEVIIAGEYPSVIALLTAAQGPY